MAAEPAKRRRDDTDTIIARMEASLHEERASSPGSDAVSNLNWHVVGEPGRPIVWTSNSPYEAVSAPSRTKYDFVVNSYSRDKVFRFIESKDARQKGHAGNEGGDSEARRKVHDWVMRVPSDQRSRFTVDLDYAVRRLGLIFRGNQGLIWLESFNYSLNARPIDVLRERGPAEVIAAMDAEEAGAL